MVFGVVGSVVNGVGVIVVGNVLSEKIVTFMREMLPERPSLFAEIEKECMRIMYR